MSKHTQEPWFDDRATHDEPYQNIKILGDENRGICCLWIDDAPVDDWNTEQRANARRIVACVNAMVGIGEDNALFFPGNSVRSVISSMKIKQLELAQQRDQLLAALNVAEGFVSEVSEKTGFGQVHTLKVIREAIAKASVGAS